MIAFETTREVNEGVVVEVFVSMSDLGGRDGIRIGDLADKVNSMVGMRCTDYERTYVSSSSREVGKLGYLLRCSNISRSYNTAPYVRSLVEAVLESLKEERL